MVVTFSDESDTRGSPNAALKDCDARAPVTLYVHLACLVARQGWFTLIGASRRATTYMPRPSYHYYIAPRDRYYSSTTKINHQTWISDTSSLSMLIFKCWLHPFHHILAFWFECLRAFVAFGAYQCCITHMVYIDQKRRHVPETRGNRFQTRILNI